MDNYIIIVICGLIIEQTNMFNNSYIWKTTLCNFSSIREDCKTFEIFSFCCFCNSTSIDKAIIEYLFSIVFRYKAEGKVFLVY